jgi:hypothetical protein
MSARASHLKETLNIMHERDLHLRAQRQIPGRLDANKTEKRRGAIQENRSAIKLRWTLVEVDATREIAPSLLRLGRGFGFAFSWPE